MESPEVAQAILALRAEYERRRFLNAASGNGGDNLDSAVLVESAQTLPPGTWSPSLGVSSTKGTYKFPLTLAVHPPTPTGNGELRFAGLMKPKPCSRIKVLTGMERPLVKWHPSRAGGFCRGWGPASLSTRE